MSPLAHGPMGPWTHGSVRPPSQCVNEAFAEETAHPQLALPVVLEEGGGDGRGVGGQEVGGGCLLGAVLGLQRTVLGFW